MIPPPKPPKLPRPDTKISPELEIEIRDYIREQKQADLVGTVERLSNLILQESAHNRQEHQELENRIKGVSLRVGVLERDRDRHEKDIDESQRFLIEDLKEKRERAEARFWKYVAAAASLLALASTVWHFFR